MMYPNRARFKNAPLKIAALASLLLASRTEAQVTPVTMSDANSTAIVEVGSDAGMYFWSVNGPSGINQLAQQWFFYRIGSSGANDAINKISTATYSQTTAGGNDLSIVYNNDALRVEIDYGLTGFGSGMADI